MEGADYPPMSGTNTINSVTVVLETGILAMREPVTELVLYTLGVLVRVAAACRDGKCESVTFENVPGSCVCLDVPVEVPEARHRLHWMSPTAAISFCVAVGSPRWLCDRARGGRTRLAELGERIKSAAAEQLAFHHPTLPAADQLGFVVWTAPARVGGDGRNGRIVSPGRLDRSPY